MNQPTKKAEPSAEEVAVELVNLAEDRGLVLDGPGAVVPVHLGGAQDHQRVGGGLVRAADGFGRNGQGGVGRELLH